MNVRADDLDAVAITGAGGKTGLALIHALQRRGIRVRGLTRAATGPASAAGDATGVEWFVGDLRDPRALASLLDGASALYHVCPNMHAQEFDIGRSVIEVAQQRRLRFVYHSVLHPQTEAMAHHWQKMRVEEALFQSGLDYTVLQPAAYMQNVLAQRTTIVQRGEYPVPYSVHTRVGMVDLADVAEVAAKVLTEPGHSWATYELCADELLTQVQIVEQIGGILGRPIRAAALPREAWAEGARRQGLSEYAVETLLAMFVYYEAFGFWGNSTVLRALLGREPTSFRTFLERELKP